MKKQRLSVVRILDSRREQFRLSKAYEHKADVMNVITAPEIEMLIIHNEDVYERFKHSEKKSSNFCKTELHIHNVKSYNFVRSYFNDPNNNIHVIVKYQRKEDIPRGEYSLADLLGNL